jgi:hypothetical protein
MESLLRALHDGGVEWVVSGSTVLAIYGADLVPNDLDVVPSLEPANLRRLAEVLAVVDAVPAYFPDWQGGLSLVQCREWTPEPPTPDRLDHLFVTRFGLLDISPTLTGSYESLSPGAMSTTLAGVPVLVCDPDEVLRRLPQRQRAKDRRRAATYAAVRARLRHDRFPRGLSRWGRPPGRDRQT